MSNWVIRLGIYIDFVVYCSMLIPLGMAWSRRAYLSGGLRPLAILPAFLFVSYWLVQLGIYLWHNNLPIIHLNTICETIIYIQVFRKEFINFKTQQSIKWLLLAFSCFAIVDSFVLEGFKQINSYTNLAENIIVSGLILAYIEELIFDKKVSNLFDTPVFVASIGILLYLAGTVMIFLFTNHFITTNDEFNARIIYLISSFLVFILAMLLTRAFYLVKAPATKPQAKQWR